jgi:hypothetical protein
MMANNPSGMNADSDSEPRYVFYSVIAGLIALVVCFVVAIIGLHGSSNMGQSMNSTITPVAGIIGTLVGLVAGQQVGAAGRRKAEIRADDMTNKMTDNAKLMSKYEGMLAANNISTESGQAKTPMPGGASNP